MKQIDVILITYNQEQFVRQAIESIFMQQVSDNWKIKIIIADDCSLDKTLYLIKEEEKNSPFPIQYLTTSHNLGHPQNYKRAFHACKGDYVAILEGDDYWTDTHRLQKHVDFLEQHREAVLSMNDMYVYCQESGLFENTSRLRPSIDYFTGQETARGNRLGNLSACVIRNSVLQQLPLEIYDTDMDDWLLGLCLARYGYLVVFGEKMSVYRMHSRGQWSGISRVERIEIDLARAERYDKLTSGMYHNDFEIFKRVLQGKSHWRKRISRNMPLLFKWILKLLLPPTWYKLN